MRAVCRSVPSRPENTTPQVAVFCFLLRREVVRGWKRAGQGSAEGGGRLGNTWNQEGRPLQWFGGAYVLAAFSGLLRPCNCCAAGRRGGCAGLGRSTAWGEGRERGPPVQSFTHSPSCPQKLIMGSRALELSRTLIIWIIWHQPRRRAAEHSLPGVCLLLARWSADCFAACVLGPSAVYRKRDSTTCIRDKTHPGLLCSVRGALNQPISFRAGR